jgi:hypothetical protein
MPRFLLIGVLVLSACGPGPTTSDAGSDPIDAGSDASSAPIDTGTDAGMSCDGTPEGTFTCTPGHQCCGGQWVTFVDGPCFPRDAGTLDAGPADCTASPHAIGCPCPTEGATECRAYQSSLRCTGGVWTDLVNVACCVGP